MLAIRKFGKFFLTVNTAREALTIRKFDKI